MKRVLLRGLVLWLCALPLLSTSAHELQENKVSLTLREHVDAVFYLNLLDTLQRISTKPTPRLQLLASLASQSEDEFAKTWKATTSSFQAEVQFRASGKALATSPWVWTDARQVHQYLREVTMSSIATPDQHVHDMTFEARVQIKSKETTLNVTLPESLKPMTLVTLVPKQYRIERGSPKINLSF